MENNFQRNKKFLLIAFLAILVVLGVAMFFIWNPFSNDEGDELTNILAIRKEYTKAKDQFMMDLPCGVTDFDSPYAKPMKCDSSKSQKGESVKMTFSGNIYDKSGNTISGAKLTVNGGEAFYSENDGSFSKEIVVDSIKQAINVVVDKDGYSPIRKILFAKVISQDQTSLEFPKEYYEDIVVEEAEVKSINISSSEDIVVISDKYPGLSITVPANGLVDSKGNVVMGTVTGEITYLNPANPEDAKFTPGIADGDSTRMVGINQKGEQVILATEGMTFFHFKKAGSDEILQLKEGVKALVTQPMTTKADEYFNDTVIQQEAMFSDNDLKRDNEELKKMGVTDDMTEEEIYKILFENDKIAFSYWYFNQRTNLWEVWPVSSVKYYPEKGYYSMEVTALY